MNDGEVSGGRIALYGVLVVLIVSALGFGGWAFGIWFSGPKGAGEAIKQNNSKVNRIGQQEQFEQLAADYDGFVVKIKAGKAAVASAVTETDKQLRATELVGLRQVCVDAAQQFNANSRKYTARDWKSAGLPARLDPDACTS